jgi:hypothetical protein
LRFGLVWVVSFSAVSSISVLRGKSRELLDDLDEWNRRRSKAHR